MIDNFKNCDFMKFLPSNLLVFRQLMIIILVLIQNVEDIRDRLHLKNIETSYTFPIFHTFIFKSFYFYLILIDYSAFILSLYIIKVKSTYGEANLAEVRLSMISK